MPIFFICFFRLSCYTGKKEPETGGDIMASVCGYSKIGKQQLETIDQLEKELGTTILAFSCNDVLAAQLSKEQLGRLQALEQEIGVSLIALSS